MNIELHAKILKLRSILNGISDVSYQYRQLNDRHRMADLKPEDAEKLVVIYEDLIRQVISLIAQKKP